MCNASTKVLSLSLSIKTKQNKTKNSLISLYLTLKKKKKKLPRRAGRIGNVHQRSAQHKMAPDTSNIVLAGLHPDTAIFRQRTVHRPVGRR
jgi:hypothetical protein